LGDTVVVPADGRALPVEGLAHDGRVIAALALGQGFQRQGEGFAGARLDSEDVLDGQGTVPIVRPELLAIGAEDEGRDRAVVADPEQTATEDAAEVAGLSARQRDHAENLPRVVGVT
jgi:hypothetical protein